MPYNMSTQQFNNNPWDAIDIIAVLSFALGLENLQENREQSAHNDVQAANDKQAKYLLDELTNQFERQNQMLEFQNSVLLDIQKRLNRLEGKA